MKHNSPSSASGFALALKQRSSWLALLAANVLVASPMAQTVGTNQGSESEPNNTFGTADALSGSAGSIKASLFAGIAGSQGTDVDFYSFTTTVAGAKIYAAVVNSQASSQDTVLAVLASDGTTVLELDDQDGSFGGSSSSIAGTVLGAAGTYYLRVTDFSTTAPISTYSLYFTVQDPATVVPETEPNNNGTPQVQPAGGYVSGVIDPLADTDTFSFSANAGDTVFLSEDLDPERDVTTFNGRIGLGIFGAPPSFLVTSDGGTFDTIDSEALVMTVKVTGTYTVYVDAQVATAGPTQTYNYCCVVIPAVAPTGTVTTYTNATPTPIADLALTSSTINIPDSKIIKSLRVVVDITHANFPDLDVHLRSPAVNDNGLFTDVGVATQTGAQNYEMAESSALPILFTIVNGARWQTEPAYRLHWFNGENTLGTWTLDIRDDLTANAGTLNSWSLIVEEEPAPTGLLVYNEDFEANNGGYTSSGTANEWEYGTPATLAQTGVSPFIAPFLTAASGVSCWKTDLDNTYDVSSNQTLTSPTLNLGAIGGSGPLTLSWQQRYQLESNSFDRAWVRVTDVANPTNSRIIWHSDNQTMGEANGSGASLGNLPESAGWGRYSGDISDFVGLTVQVSFNLESDSSLNYGGLAIDDVQIRTGDLCPGDPNKTDPGACGCGVPDTDTDGDLVADCIDNCPAIPNAGQEDPDADGVGTACDNCPANNNPGQEDCDNDSIGDACAGEPDCNNNSVPDSCDIANSTSTDLNSNGIPDECENGGTPFCFGDSGCPCSNNSATSEQAGCRNSTGLGGRMVGVGNTSVSNDTLTLQLTNLPGNPGVAFFFQYAATAPATFHGDGLKCWSGTGLFRFGPVNPIPPGSGSASYPGVGQPPVSQVEPVPPTGGARYYQAVYRQPQATSPCAPTTQGLNTTNGLSVVWAP